MFYKDMQSKGDLEKQYSSVAQRIASLPPSDPQFNSVYQQFKDLNAKFDARNEQLIKDYPDNFFTNKLLCIHGSLDVRKQAATFRAEFWDGFDFNEPGLIYTPAFYNKLNRYFTELVPQQQDSINKYADVLMKLAGDNDEYYKTISNWIALKYEPGKTKLMDGEAVYSHIILDYFTPEKAKWLDDVSITTLRKELEK
ncbi:MAG: DUF5106 domain-containing protein [Saprospiraceae bacterium]